MATYNVKGQDFQTFDIPTMSRELQKYVLQLCRFRQLVTKKENIGTGKGVKHRWFFPGTDPEVKMYDRFPKRESFLTEGQYSILKNEAVVRELGYSMKYNIHDIDLAQLPVLQYIREILGRDCARAIDYLVKAELDLTPWKYIPTSDSRGATTSLESYLKTTTSEEKFTDLDLGKIPLSERVYYGCWGNMESPYLSDNQRFDKGTYLVEDYFQSSDSVCLVPNPLTFVTKTINGGTTIQYGLGPYYQQKVGIINEAVYPVNMKAVDPSYSDAHVFDINYEPRLNYRHLMNMVLYAQRINMYGFAGLNNDYILICSPLQAMNLISSLGVEWVNNDKGDATLRRLLTPNTMEAMRGTLWGENIKIPLGLPVRIVVDNEGILKEENWIHEGAKVTTDEKTEDLYPDKLIETTFGAIADGAGYVTTGNTDEKTRFGLSSGFAAWITPKKDTYGGRINIGDNGPHGFTGGVLNRRFPSLGPCYLIGSGESGVVQEILSMPEQVVKQSPLDFNRFGGLAWKMWVGYRATNVIGKLGWTKDNNATTVLFADNDIKTALTRMKCIKFDYPLIIQDTKVTKLAP